MDLPPPLTQFKADSGEMNLREPSSTSELSSPREPADSGAEGKDSPVDLEIVGEVPMDIEEESSTWR